MSSRLNSVFQRLKKCLALNEVTGLDIGYRLENGEHTNELAVRIHTEGGCSKTLTSFTGKEKNVQFIQGEFNLSTGALHAPVMNPITVERRKIIQPGISVGTFDCGTLGLICNDDLSSSLGFLTCYHVIDGIKGDAVTQPAPGIDGGNFSRDKIGTLERFLSYAVHYDAAFVKLNGTRETLSTQIISNVLVQPPKPIALNDMVVKVGRTTGYTEGKVTAQGFYPIVYPGHGRKLINGWLVESLNNEKTSDVGDSGAVWYDRTTLHGKGLQFATGTNKISSLMAPLIDVMRLLKISPYYNNPPL